MKITASALHFKVDLNSYDAIVCLRGGNTEADDSELLVSLLSLQQAAKKQAGASVVPSLADGVTVEGVRLRTKSRRNKDK